MFLLVGLGNVGAGYAKTRHNFGFMVADALVQEYGFGAAVTKFRSSFYQGHIGVHKVLLLKPNTLMNRSGVAVAEAMRFYRVPLSQVVVFHDDLDVGLGKIKMKTGGGTGGHNGLADIDVHCGKDYRRVRLGIDHPGHKDKVHGYVLKAFAKKEVDVVDAVIAAVVQHVPCLLAEDGPLFLTRCAESLKN